MDVDSVSGNSDTAFFAEDVSYDQLWFKKVSGTSDLTVSIIGAADVLTIKGWYISTNNRIEKFKSSDGKVLTHANVEKLVSAMSSLSAPELGEIKLSASYHSALDGTLSAYWV